MKQSIIEKIIYYIVGTVFFIAYYYLMKEVFHINPFTKITVLLSIYLLIAIITFPISGEILSNKTKDYIIGSKLIMPLAYVSGPIIVLIHKRCS